jgi:hypothetical protein
MTGIHGIANGLHEEIRGFPDFVLQIQSVKIYQKEHVAGCKIIIQSLMKGTMLIDSDMLAQAAAAQAQAQLALTKKRSASSSSSSNKKKKGAVQQLVDMTTIPTLSSSLQVPTAAIEGLAASFNQLTSFFSGAVPKIVPIFHKLVTQTTFSVDEDFKIYHIDVIDEFVPA